MRFLSRLCFCNAVSLLLSVRLLFMFGRFAGLSSKSNGVGSKSLSLTAAKHT